MIGKSNTDRLIFNAPWSRQLRWLTGIFSSVLLGTSLLLYLKAPPIHSALYALGLWLPLVILALSGFFAIRGYAQEGTCLLILRPGWNTRFSLADLEVAEADPQAMHNAIRLFGNGGLFGFIGLYHSGKLGRFRAYATNNANAVVLKFPGRTLVITPDKPQQFLATLQRP